MSLEEEVALLKSVPLFRAIDPAKLKLLAFISDRVTFREGEDLMIQGEDGDSAFVIVSGGADVVVTIDGAERVVASLGKNDIVGEIAITCDVPRTATVRATSELDALMITKANFLKLLHEVPEMALEMLRVLGLRLERTTRELAEVRSELAAAGQR